MSFDADKEERFQRLGSVFRKVIGVVNHRTTEMAARHRCEHSSGESKCGESSFATKGKNQCQKAADNDREAEIHVQIHRSPGKSLNRHQHVAEDGGSAGTEKRNPENEWQRIFEMSEFFQSRENIHPER